MDLVIRGGTIVDGSGAPAFTGDVGVDGDRIVAVGRVDARGAREVDAAGLVVTPGFVDIHTHYDGQATWDPVLAPSSNHGVTSIAMGNCGVGFAPAAPGDDAHAWLISLLEGVEDIPGTALAEGLPWDWETFPQYLDALGRRRYTLDVATHVPHAAVRAYVMGERGADADVVPTADEIAHMAALVEEGVRAGGLGFTTSRTLIHRTRDGKTIGTYRAGLDEVLGVADGLRRAGTGVVQLISDAYLLEDPEFAETELVLLEELARTTGRPLSFTCQQPDSNRDRWARLIAWAGEQAAAGLPVAAQVAPRPISVLLGLQATLNPFVFCRSFREVAHLPLAELVAELQRPERRERILAEHPTVTRYLPGFSSWPWHRLFPLGDPPDYEPPVEASIAAEAARQGRPAAEVAYDLVVADGGRSLLFCPLMNYASGSLDEVREMLASPNVVYGLSDGGAHCGAICDASFPTTILAYWGRDRAAKGRGPGLPIEHLVRGVTRRTAEQVGWFDRGLVAPGMLADLNVIDLERLDCRAPRIVHDLPAGGRRLVQDATGYVATIKRGVTTFANGEHTGELPGQLVRGAQPAPA